MTTRHMAVLVVSLALLAAGGCATATIEDAVPTAAAEQGTGERPAEEPAFSEPGEYPNLNVNPAPAAPQITDAEKRTDAAELRARRERLAGEAAGRRVTDRSAELRRLAARHADAALQEIEGE